MIEEKDFIINKIKELVNHFTDSMIGYEYKEESLIHFIKTKPIEIFKNKDFKKFCSEILMEYIDKYNGSICFISEEDPISLDNPEIYFHPGKLIKHDQHYKIQLNTREEITNSINFPKDCLNNNYSLAA